MPEAAPDRFRLFVDSVKDYAFIQFDKDNCVTDWNTGAQRLLGYTEPEILGKHGSIFFTPEDRARNAHQEEINTALAIGTAEDERWHLRKDASRFRASGVLTKLCDEEGKLVGFAKVLRDVTEREQAHDRIRKSSAEKEALIREIHHRVKNNLQIIVSLLSLQSQYVRDPNALSSLEETTNRVRSIARIHEAIYGSPDLASVPFDRYLTQVVSDLATFYDIRQRIETRVDAVPATLDIEQAIPLALLTNEVVCNAMKHAFPQREGGRLDVKLTLGEGHVEVSVDDDGIGLPQNFDPAIHGSMGFELIQILTEQLNARLSLRSEHGTCISVRIPTSRRSD